MNVDADATDKGFYAERNEDGDWMLKFNNEKGKDSGDITLAVTAKNAEGQEIASQHTVNVVLEHRIHLWGVYGDEDNFTINKYPGSGIRYIAFHHDDNRDIGKCDVNLEVLDNTGIDIKAEYEDSGIDEEGQKYSSYKVIYSGAGHLAVGDKVKLKLTVTSNGVTTVYDDIVMPVVEGYDMEAIANSATMRGKGIAFRNPWFDDTPEVNAIRFDWDNNSGLELSKDIPSLDLSFAPPTLNIGAFGANSEFVCDTDTLRLINTVPGRNASLSYSSGKINLNFGDVGFYYLDATYYCKNDPSISFKVRLQFAAEISFNVSGFTSDVNRPYKVYYKSSESVNVSIPITVRRTDGKPITEADDYYNALVVELVTENDKGEPASQFEGVTSDNFELVKVESDNKAVAKYNLNITVPDNFAWDDAKQYFANLVFRFNLEPKNNDVTPHPYWVNGGEGDFFRILFEKQSDDTAVTIEDFRVDPNYFDDIGYDDQTLLHTIKYNKPIQLGTNGTATITMPRGAINWQFRRGDKYLGGYFRSDEAGIQRLDYGNLLKFTFDNAKTYEMMITCDEAEENPSNKQYPAIKVIFNVDPAPTATPAPTRTPEPYYPPYIPDSPTATPEPTATPAPTTTAAPVPTEAPTAEPTQAPTTAPDVIKQVSAGGKRLNVRSAPGGGSSVIAKLNDGSKVTVISTENGWSHIRAALPNGSVVEGYVSDMYLAKIAAPTTAPAANARVSTNGSALRLRSGASTSSAVIARMPNGANLTVLERANGWMRVRFTAANGSVFEGWASAEYIALAQ